MEHPKRSLSEKKTEKHRDKKEWKVGREEEMSRNTKQRYGNDSVRDSPSHGAIFICTEWLSGGAYAMHLPRLTT